MLLLREEPPAEPRSTPPPREGRAFSVFVAASVLGHVALVAAAPAMEAIAAAPTDELVFLEMAPVPPAQEPVVEAPVVEEPEPERQPRVLPEVSPAAPEEPTEAPAADALPSIEPTTDEPALPEATPSTVDHAGEGAAATVASTEGGLAVDRAAGPGTEGDPEGATRRPQPTVDRGALQAWRISALRAMGRPEATLALRRTGLEGIAVVAFRVDAQGRVVGVRLFRSSGHEVVDEAALSFARSRHALPAPPAPWQTREVRLPIRYRRS